jgi:D-arabinose 1-dehydrogenase-like Zn-dependent alcohol dehydrogenase
MINPFQQIPGVVLNNPAMGQTGQIFEMAQVMQNPQAVVGQMMGNNEQLQQVMQYIREHGGDPKSAFYELAKEKGVDPFGVLKQARTMINQK